VTLEDRERVFHRIQQNPERIDFRAKEPTDPLRRLVRQTDAEEAALERQQQQQQQKQQHQQSALETLAEVSRHHLDYSTHHVNSSHSIETAGRTISEILVEQALLDELRGQAEVSPFASIGRLPQQPVSTSTASAKPSCAPNETSPVQYRTSHESPLIETASATTRELDLLSKSNPVGATLVDPQLNSDVDARRPSEAPPGGEAVLRGVDGSVDSAVAEGFASLAPRAISEDTHSTSDPVKLGFGLSENPQKIKKRGRFEDSRRKQVSEVRKQGACIRCRMLKKPCSEGTPCSTCSTVEAARVWKGQCVRTRLADELTSWSNNTFRKRAEIALYEAVRGRTEVSRRENIIAKMFRGSEPGISFAAKVYRNDEEVYQPTDCTMASLLKDPTTMCTLIEEVDSVDEFAEHMTRHVDSIIEAEPSLFAQKTLELARKMMGAEAKEEAERPAEVLEGRPRSSYALRNQLLANVVELWSLTRLLTTDAFECFELRHRVTDPAQPEQDSLDLPHERCDPSGEPIPEGLSHGLVRLQVLGMLESRCAKLSRTITNELERRLLQRQQASPLATFLASVILLNCVERMCSLDLRLSKAEVNSSATLAQTSESGQAHASRYQDLLNPFATQAPREAASCLDADKSPSAGAENTGEQFAKLFAMLVRMRALPPATIVKQDGTLGASPDPSLAKSRSSEPVSAMDSFREQYRSVEAWLDPLRLSVDELIAKRDGVVSQNSETDAWDMRFVSRLLLPENISKQPVSTSAPDDDS